MEANGNFARLHKNPYPGRVIVVGLDESESFLVQVYAIMGRGDNSRNRVFKSEGGRLYTEPADPAKMKPADRALVIYNAMERVGRHHVVSNGAQTDGVVQSLRRDMGRSPLLQTILQTTKHEPDAPNFTPRITALSSLSGSGRPYLQLSILRRSPFGDESDRISYDYDRLCPGLGYFISTYMGDGSPLPPFRGEPLLMPVRKGLQEVAQTYWQALNPENRVSLAVKFIDRNSADSQLFIINKYHQVG